ncbi:MAG: transposase [Candidatus Schekmanbacteria bacterium]|nr:transposase [Candidatus Schekmanbacteria bacterium]
MKLNVQVDHVHMVIVVPPRVAVAEVVQFIKVSSAKTLKAKIPFLKKTYFGQMGIWSRGCCVPSLSKHFIFDTYCDRNYNLV